MRKSYFAQLGAVKRRQNRACSSLTLRNTRSGACYLLRRVIYSASTAQGRLERFWDAGNYESANPEELARRKCLDAERSACGIAVVPMLQKALSLSCEAVDHHTN